MAKFVLTGEGRVGPEWMDENDHMNMMWYTHVIDNATGALFSKMGLKRHTDNFSFVAARISTIHRRELRLGDVWQVWTGLMDAASNQLVFTHKITQHNVIAAKSEIVVVPFDKTSRASVTLSPDEIAKARAYIIPGLVKQI